MKKYLAIVLACICLWGLSLTAFAETKEIVTTNITDSTVFHQEWKDCNFAITYQDKTWGVRASDLANVPILVYVEDGVVKCAFRDASWLHRIVMQVNHDLASGSVPTEGIPSNCALQLVNGFEGWMLNVIQTQLLAGPVKDIEIALNENTCRVATRAEIENNVSLLNIEDYVLAGSCTTSFKGSSSNRINNVRVATNHVNGFVLGSGQSASVDKLFTPRTVANGYKEAGTYVGGKVVMGLGGGICQVSSTLYDALMNAGMMVTMRYPHSSPVHYLPLGMDAAISSGSKDLRFTNPYNNPIFLESTITGTNVTINVYVQKKDLNGYSYKLWSKKSSAMSAITYQTVYLNGVEVETRTIGSSKYVPLKEE